MPDSTSSVFYRWPVLMPFLMGAAGLAFLAFNGRHHGWMLLAWLAACAAVAVFGGVDDEDAGPSAAFLAFLALPLFDLAAGLAAVAGYTLPDWSLCVAAGLPLLALRPFRGGAARCYSGNAKYPSILPPGPLLSKKSKSSGSPGVTA